MTRPPGQSPNQEPSDQDKEVSQESGELEYQPEQGQHQEQKVGTGSQKEETRGQEGAGSRSRHTDVAWDTMEQPGIQVSCSV